MVNNYLDRKYISPEAIWAEVKLMLKSYFESGALDDVLFPIWTEKCIKKFRRAAYPLKETYLRIENYEACLPDDFKFVKEAWICGEAFTVDYQHPGSFYYETDCIIGDEGDTCNPCTPCQGDSRKVFHKSTGHTVFTFTYSHLLSPGSIRTRECCHQSPNLTQNCPDKFDIVDGKFIVNLSTAGVYLSYHADYYIDGNPLIEDNHRMIDYVTSFLLFKCMETLMNNLTDDTFNQISQKYQLYKQEAAEMLILAEIEARKQTKEQQKAAFNRTKNKYLNHDIPGNPNNRYNGRY